MATYRVSPHTAQAVLLFADVVDSSQYSAILGYQKYAEKLLAFQDLFESLAKMYFGDCVSTTDKHTSWRARGDEGFVFCVDFERDVSEVVYQAIQFVLELKMRLRYMPERDGDGDRAPRQIGLGAGIHYGEVACITRLEGNRSVIDRIEGHSINFAKRVESCSRSGRHSRVFVSQDAERALDGDPVVLSMSEENMKGIGEKIPVYEVRSAYFQDLPTDDSSKEGKELLEKVLYLSDHPADVVEPWMKSIVVSVLDRLARDAAAPVRKAYNDRLSRIVWHSPVEEDPIVLYLRSRECRKGGRRTHEVRYLNKLLSDCPAFVPARIAMVDACMAIIQSDSERSEKVYARDTAKEFLEHFARYLNEEEKAGFRALLAESPAAS